MKSTPKKSIDILFKLDIAKINNHLPRQFKTLDTLLKEDKPSVLTKDGTKFIFNKNELAELKSQLPEEFHSQLRLPFLFIRRTDLGKSIFVLNGGKLENLVARKLIDLIDDPINQYKIFNLDLPKYFYWADLRAFRKKFKTLFTIGFSAGASTI
ncbi:DUF61 family protein [Candidatus Borrarchaeum sp.]|uniref:DUF61 family protein n=1 Tax=Candidatus Borrarchaeum sp. TaxID=2846742 RepID=UPI00257C1228|nr:DUF61 family protein [Candidatus Borrarchaeum sp.]